MRGDKKTTNRFGRTLLTLALALLTGVVASLVINLFFASLNVAIVFLQGIRYFFLIIPLSLFISGLIIYYVAPETSGHSTEVFISRYYDSSNGISLRYIFVKIFCSILTIASGGSAGRNGPGVQVAGGLSLFISNCLKLGPKTRKIIVTCSVCAGFTAVFGAFAGGLIFGLEWLKTEKKLQKWFLYLLPSCAISLFITRKFGLILIPERLEMVNINFRIIPFVLAGGIFFGLCSLFFIEVLYNLKKVSKKIKLWFPLKGLIGGTFILIVSLIFSLDYLGLGLESISGFLEGSPAPFHSFILKSILTSVTLDFCGSGGLISPIFYIGSSAGSFYGSLINQNISLFAALGMVAVLSGCTNTPAGSFLISIEMFGLSIAPYSLIVVLVSFFMTRKTTVYFYKEEKSNILIKRYY